MRDFDTQRKVSQEVKLNVLAGARLTGSGNNSQHWKFILVQDRSNIRKLADDSTTGKWAQRCNFAVIILTDPKLPFYLIDAGRAIQDMQLAAWNSGLASGLFTGMSDVRLKKDFDIPSEYEATAVVCFGYPNRKITGRKKNRKALSDISFLEKFGNPMDPRRL